MLPTPPGPSRPATPVRRVASVAALAGLVVAALLLARQPAPARAADAPASSPAAAQAPPPAGERTVTLPLTLPPAASVDQRERGEGRRQRLRQLRPTDPTAARRVATQLGLRVGSDDGLTLTVTGPAATVDRLFGGRAGRPGQALRLPRELAPYATAALDTDDTRPVVHRHAAPGSTGATYAAAYSAPAGAFSLEPTPTFTAATPVVATVQFSGWDDAALSLYAADHLPGLPDPRGGTVAQYTGIGVGRATTWQQSDGDGYVEVALDQESILGAAPRLRQRAYIGPNTGAGIVETYRRVLADVTAGVPVAALSTSWGSCEADTGATIRSQLDAVFAQLQAAGTSVFAASGDGGRYDCQDGTTQLRYRGSPSVDYPASSPFVLGVGGTRHPGGTAPPAPDTGWDGPVGTASDGSVSASGSGGGTSAAYPAPSYQQSIGLSGGRQVPDLALEGDPATGMPLAFTDSAAGATSPTESYPGIYGGTSLAAPLSAAMLADVTLSHGCPAGIGDLHPALYAASGSSGIRDVVAYTDAGATTHSAYPPATGYDAATGVGTPVWTSLAGRFFSDAGCTLRRTRLAVVTDPAATGVMAAVAAQLPVTGPGSPALSVRPIGGGGTVAGQPDDCAVPVPDTGPGALAALRGDAYPAGGGTAGPLAPPCVLGAVTTGTGP